MYVHPIRSDDASLAPIALHPVEPKVAVLLNANAKRVNEKVRRTLSHVVPEGDLFLTRTFEEARAVAETVVERRYQTVFTGGGESYVFVGDAVHYQRRVVKVGMSSTDTIQVVDGLKAGDVVLLSRPKGAPGTRGESRGSSRERRPPACISAIAWACPACASTRDDPANTLLH